MLKDFIDIDNEKKANNKPSYDYYKYKSYAKINYNLDIFDKNNIDNYHYIDTFMQEINLCDELDILEYDKFSIDQNFLDKVYYEYYLIKNGLTQNDSTKTLTWCKYTFGDCNFYFSLINELGYNLDTKTFFINNTLIKILDFLNEKNFFINSKKEIFIILRKKIPLQAGLGGGSSNAVSFLQYLNKSFHISNSLNILEICKNIGKDAVAQYYLSEYYKNKAVRFLNYGDIPYCFEHSVFNKLLIIQSDFKNSTVEAYAYIDNKVNKNKKISYSNMFKLISAISSKSNIEIFTRAENTFYNLSEYWNQLQDKFKNFIIDHNILFKMTGSGSALYIDLNLIDDDNVVSNLEKICEELSYFIKQSS